MRTAAADHPPPNSAGGGPAAREESVVSQLCRAAMLIAVCRSLYTSGGYPLCICCHKQFYFGGAPGDDDTQNANVDGGEISLLTKVRTFFFFSPLFYPLSFAGEEEGGDDVCSSEYTHMRFRRRRVFKTDVPFLHPFPLPLLRVFF